MVARKKKPSMTVSTIISAFLHAIIILGVTLNPLITKIRQAQPTLEITVATQATKKPEQADFLAAVNHEGGGDNDEKVAPTSRALQLQSVAQLSVPTPKKTPTKAVITARQNPNDNASSKERPTPDVEPPQNTAAEPVELQISNLVAQIDRQQNEIARRPHRRQVSAATHEARDAEYLDYWRRRVESIGNLNYPSEAKRQNLSGDLRLLVAINKDGTINTVSVRESSGLPVLDNAAIQIVKLAAPFQPLPPEIRKDTDILEIIRTWHFGNDARLVATN